MPNYAPEKTLAEKYPEMVRRAEGFKYWGMAGVCRLYHSCETAGAAIGLSSGAAFLRFKNNPDSKPYFSTEKAAREHLKTLRKSKDAERHVAEVEKWVKKEDLHDQIAAYVAKVQPPANVDHEANAEMDKAVEGAIAKHEREQTHRHMNGTQPAHDSSATLLVVCSADKLEKVQRVITMLGADVEEL